MNNHMDALVAPVEVEYSRWMHATHILQRYYKYLLIRCFITQALPHAHKMIRSILFMYPPPPTTPLLPPPPKVLAHCYFDSQPHSQPPPLVCSWPLTECGNELLSLGYIKGRPWNTWGSIHYVAATLHGQITFMPRLLPSLHCTLYNYVASYCCCLGICIAVMFMDIMCQNWNMVQNILLCGK